MTEILDRLEEWHDYQPGEWVARCPAHADGKPSLWLSLKESGTVGLACRAGCRFGDVVAAMGLLPRHLFNVRADGLEAAPAARPEAVSPRYVAGLRGWLDGLQRAGEVPEVSKYVRGRFGLSDADVERLGLRAWEPQPCPEWVPGSFVRYPRLVVPMHDMAGVARGAQGRDLSGRCPVRWVSLANPEGFAWQKWAWFPGPSDTVLVCEGMGDPLSAVSLGYSAVGVRGASLATSPELAELADHLRGRDVVLVGDGDKSGRRFNAALAELLGGDVRTLDLPPGTDLTDWRNAA
ncbi:toprim domain-containing protein [Kitasatospora sp. NPDC001664]